MNIAGLRKRAAESRKIWTSVSGIGDLQAAGLL
jgi:hypothetical protein